jgi:hypothetical protein
MPAHGKPAMARCSRSAMVLKFESMYGIRACVRSSSKRLRHLLHGLHHLGRAEGLSRQVRINMTGAPRIAVRHHDDHRLRSSAGDQVVEDEIGMALLDPASLIFAAAVLQIEHRVAHLGLRVVARRQIEERHDANLR